VVGIDQCHFKTNISGVLLPYVLGALIVGSGYPSIYHRVLLVTLDEKLG
jgi:hypothetical protein